MMATAGDTWMIRAAQQFGQICPTLGGAPTCVRLPVYYDVELLRILLLHLETREVSPRATVLIMLADEADSLGETVRTIEDSLNLLLELDYIEGPGPGIDGIWLFRKLTRKGVEFVRAARDLADWEEIKRRREARFPSNT